MAKTTLLNVAQYAKNVLKSTGYIAHQTMKGIDRDLYDFVEDNKELAVSTYEDVVDFKQNVKDKLSGIFSGNGLLRDLRKNAWSDLKTGKFYNPEREEAIAAEGFKDFLGEDAFGDETDPFSFNDENKEKKEGDVEDPFAEDKPEGSGNITDAEAILSGQGKSSILAANLINKSSKKYISFSSTF